MSQQLVSYSSALLPESCWRPFGALSVKRPLHAVQVQATQPRRLCAAFVSMNHDGIIPKHDEQMQRRKPRFPRSNSTITAADLLRQHDDLVRLSVNRVQSWPHCAPHPPRTKITSTVPPEQYLEALRAKSRSPSQRHWSALHARQRSSGFVSSRRSTPRLVLVTRGGGVFR